MAVLGPASLGSVANVDINSQYGQYFAPGLFEVNVAATFISSTLSIQKVVGFNSEVGFTEHVVCSAVYGDGGGGAPLISVDLPFLADGTPDEANGPADWTVVDGTWQLGFGNSKATSSAR